MKVKENVLISSLTTMRMGGAARFVIEIEKPEDIPEAYEFAWAYRLPTFVLGGGANTIGHDEGFNGAILMNKMYGMQYKDGSLRAMGGENWDNLVGYACGLGLTGIEALSKIPGTVGAAPVQNIGAYGQDISQVLENVEVFDTHDLSFKFLTREDLKFGYRKSILNTTEYGRYFVVAVTLRLMEGQMRRPFYQSLEKYIDDHGETDFSPASIRRMVSAIRDEKLPDPAKIASSGSFFKNIYVSDSDAEKMQERGWPVYRGAGSNKINAGWLIEQAGFAGKLLHGMRVNEKAALVLMNESAKGYKDLAAAREEIVSKVYDQFGYWLEQEPVEIKNEKFKW